MAVTVQPPSPVASLPMSRRDARTTGLLYLGLALTGLLGFLVVRTQIFDPDDPAATALHLVQEPGLARLGLTLEMGVVVTQALAALWFFRLFGPVHPFAAAALAVFGMVNAVAILASAACMATALQVAEEPVGDLGNAQLMYVLSENLWGVGALFFGLWLIPMGWCALRSGWMPRALGWLLVAGGTGYVVSAFVTYVAPDATVVAGLLVVPATVGELWMIGQLLVRPAGRRGPSAQASAAA